MNGVILRIREHCEHFADVALLSLCRSERWETIKQRHMYVGSKQCAIFSMRLEFTFFFVKCFISFDSNLFFRFRFRYPTLEPAPRYVEMSEKN